MVNLNLRVSVLPGWHNTHTHLRCTCRCCRLQHLTDSGPVPLLPSREARLRSGVFWAHCNLKKEHNSAMRGGWPAKQVWMYQVGGDISNGIQSSVLGWQVCQSLATNIRRFFLNELAYYQFWMLKLFPLASSGALIDQPWCDFKGPGIGGVESKFHRLVSSFKIPLENRW